MSLAERLGYEAGLAEGKSTRRMAAESGRSISTLTREFAKHTYISYKGTYGCRNLCVHRQTCQKSNVCTDCRGSNVRCAVCTFRKCNALCREFEFIDCDKRRLKTAQVCNGCPDEKRCHLVKKFYIAEHAHHDATALRSESRQGAAVPDGELAYLDALISPKIKDGQSMHHIVMSQPGAFTRNERTLSRYLHYGMFSAKRGDMKRSCMVRERKPKSKEYEHKVEKGCYADRTYKDYEKFRSENPGLSPVLMDLVIGKIGGRCMLTLHFADSAFMIARWIPNKCADSVIAVFDELYEELGHDLFTKLFGLILTDRGTEFSNPSRIEKSADGKNRCRVFFCDPMNSNQKSQCERNHEIVREVYPKGVFFEGQTQAQLDLAMSHVNAYIRLSQSDRTPYDVFEFLRGEGVAAKLRIMKIDPKEVILKPRLVGIEMK